MLTERATDTGSSSLSALAPAGRILRFLLRQPTSVFGLVVIALLVFGAILAPLLATHAP